MSTLLKHEARRQRLHTVGALAVTVALAACGGGGGDEPSKGPYFAVEGSTSTSGALRTVCIEGIEYIDPVTAKGQQIAANLVAYYGFVGRYTAYAAEGRTCREGFSNLQVVLSVDDYNRVILPWVLGGGGGGGGGGSPAPAPGPAPGPSPTPAPAPAPTPAPAPAPISPKPCASTSGSGVGGLQLYGQASYSGLSSLPNVNANVLFDPGEISFNNPNLTSSSRTGSLRATLWAVDSSYAGGAISGYIVARYQIVFNDGSTQLLNGQSSNLVAQSLAARTPPRGAYCMVATFDEYSPSSCPGSSDGYCVVDWQQFGTSAIFQ